jgi:molecular chaperone GrpE (heat shock protein)
MKDGKFLVAKCKAWSLKNDRIIAEQMGKNKSADGRKGKTELQCERLEQQIKEGEISLRIMEREDTLSRVEHEAKLGKYYTEADVCELAKIFVGVLDSGIRAVEMITHDQHCVAAVQSEFDRARNELRKILEKENAKPATT